jgi:DNA-directed RNA polymerase subunit M/transcription elongation factor TFIIS
MDFCSNCQNLLEKYTGEGRLRFTCPNCFTVKEDISPENTLILTIRKGGVEDNSYYANLAKQNYTTKSDQKCIKCSNGITTVIYTGDNFMMTYICGKCGVYFNKAAVK